MLTHCFVAAAAVLTTSVESIDIEATDKNTIIKKIDAAMPSEKEINYVCKQGYTLEGRFADLSCKDL